MKTKKDSARRGGLRPWSRRLFALGAILTALAGAALAALVWRAERDASAGGAYAMDAVHGFVANAFATTSGTRQALTNFVCDSREREVLQAVDDQKAALTDIARGSAGSYRLTIVRATSEETADRATVHANIRIDGAQGTAPGDASNTLFHKSQDWTFMIIRERGVFEFGWKVCAFQPTGVYADSR